MTHGARHTAIGREVIATEAEGLAALETSLGEVFEKAVEVLRTLKGRVIVTGMGKSGHVGRKIAATLASTGKPAAFVHPAEASHGDLGMITGDDAVLMLSKSGENRELADVIAYTRRYHIPLIAITAAADSTLGKAADHLLLLPQAAEACEETNAPTTSTTMMMALGDAVAVALLRSAGFSASDFKVFHPGGKLGASLRKVRDLIDDDRTLPLCALDTAAPEAVSILSAGGFGCIGVTDAGGLLKGIITDGDLRRHFGKDLSNVKASDIMTASPKVVAPDTLAGEALAFLSERKITALFVVENGKPAGLLHVHDCLSTGVV